MNKDLYKILGVKKKDTKAIIKKAYYSKSKEHHPDKGGDAELFNMISTAYKILIDDEKRARYDNGENVDNILKSQNNEQNKPLEIISTLFNSIVEAEDFKSKNAIKIINTLIDKNINTLIAKIKKIEKEKENCKFFLKKLKHKKRKKKDSLMSVIANGQIKQKEQLIDLLNKDKIHFEKAKELLEDFDYDVVEEMCSAFRTSFC